MGEAIAEVGYLAGLCGHTGTGWQKLQMLWGFYDVVSEAIDDFALGAGAVSKFSQVVPADEVWVISTVSHSIVSTTITSILGSIHVNGIYSHIDSVVPPTSAQWYFVTGQYILGPGDRLRWIISNCTAGDTFQARYAGYKMRLDL